jgi:hypothetical protein
MVILGSLMLVAGITILAIAGENLLLGALGLVIIPIGITMLALSIRFSRKR